MLSGVEHENSFVTSGPDFKAPPSYKKVKRKSEKLFP